MAKSIDSTTKTTLVDLGGLEADLAPPARSSDLKSAHVKGAYEYYHYRCDGFDDVGWGCGYRTLQTICSWLVRNAPPVDDALQSASKINKRRRVPTVPEIQTILHECGDKPARFVGSRDWIGCFEASIVIDHIFDVPCKILHVTAGRLGDSCQELLEHMDKYAAPAMMGGDLDNASKGILGIAASLDRQRGFLLNANPHLVVETDASAPTRASLLAQDWIRWDSVADFSRTNSFYNFCLPCCKFTA